MMHRGAFQYPHDGCGNTSNSPTILPPSGGQYNQKHRPELQECQEDPTSRASTPSLTLDSSGSGRSAASSIAPCGGCPGSSAQCDCNVQDYTDRFRNEGLDGHRTILPIKSAPHVSSFRDGSEMGDISNGRLVDQESLSPGARNTTPRRGSFLQEQVRAGSNLVKEPTQSFSDMEVCMDMNHDVCDSEMSGCDEEDDEDDTQDDDDEWSGPESYFEAMVLDILGGKDPAFAADLIPTLHKAYYSQIKTAAKQKFDPWYNGVTEYSPGEVDGMGRGRTQSSNGQFNETPGKSKKRQRTNEFSRQKNKVDNEEDEEDDEDDNQDSREMGQPTANGSPQQLPRLACPFNKRDPIKYGIRHSREENSKNSDYRTCEGPGFKNIQRLKEHIKRKHYPVQCDRCYEIFPGSDRAAGIRVLEHHRQSVNVCERKDSSLKEGISEAQCADLDKKKNAKKIPSISKIEKYMEIWDILFPGVERPKTPWYDGIFSSQHSVPLSQNSHRFSEVFIPMLEYQVNEQYIRFPKGLEAEMSDKVKTLVQIAFDMFARMYGTPSAATSSSTPSGQQTSLLGGPYEQLSTPSTGRWTSSTQSRSSGLKSQAFSSDLQSSPSANSMRTTRRHGHVTQRPSYVSPPPMVQQNFISNTMSGIQSQQMAGPEFDVGRHHVSGYNGNSFPTGDLTVDDDWLQRYSMNFPTSASAFDGSPTATGYETLDNVAIAQVMIQSPNARIPDGCR